MKNILPKSKLLQKQNILKHLFFTYMHTIIKMLMHRFMMMMITVHNFKIFQDDKMKVVELSR